MKTAKDTYIDLLAMGHTPQDIDDELLCQMMDEERELIELRHEQEQERQAEQYEQTYPDAYLYEGGE